VVARVVSSLCVAVITVGLVACQPVDDPTSHLFPITFHNDLQRPVVLKLCSDAGCHHFNYSHEWRRFQSAQENISDESLMTRWLVKDANTGETLGCIPLQVDRQYKDLVIQLSRIVRCPGQAPLAISQ
jgi:hypothetical protein